MSLSEFKRAIVVPTLVLSTACSGSVEVVNECPDEGEATLDEIAQNVGADAKICMNLIDFKVDTPRFHPVPPQDRKFPPQSGIYTNLSFQLRAASLTRVDVLDLNGKSVSKLYSKLPMDINTVMNVQWYGTNESENIVEPGQYLIVASGKTYKTECYFAASAIVSIY